MTKDIFLSVGRPATKAQECFIVAVEQLLVERGLKPRTVGRTDFVTEKPIEKIMDVMRGCSGTIIIAFERLAFDHGVEFPNGRDATALAEVHLPTVWNQIEAAMAYTMGHPLLAIAESNLRNEGFLEDGYDWFIRWVKPTPESLVTAEFLAAFEKWKEKVLDSGD
jgi:hypothetical protein